MSGISCTNVTVRHTLTLHSSTIVKSMRNSESLVPNDVKLSKAWSIFWLAVRKRKGFATFNRPKHHINFISAGTQSSEPRDLRLPYGVESGAYQLNAHIPCNIDNGHIEACKFPIVCEICSLAGAKPYLMERAGDCQVSRMRLF